MKETFDIDDLIKDLEGTNNYNWGDDPHLVQSMTDALSTLLLSRADLKKQKRHKKIQEILDSED